MDFGSNSRHLDNAWSSPSGFFYIKKEDEGGKDDDDADNKDEDDNEDTSSSFRCTAFSSSHRA